MDPRTLRLLTRALRLRQYTTLLDTYQNCCIVLLGLQALLHATINGIGYRYLAEGGGAERVRLSASNERIFNRLDAGIGCGTLLLWMAFNAHFFRRVRRRQANVPLLCANANELLDWTAPWSADDLKPPWSAKPGTGTGAQSPGARLSPVALPPLHEPSLGGSAAHAPEPVHPCRSSFELEGEKMASSSSPSASASAARINERVSCK